MSKRNLIGITLCGIAAFLLGFVTVVSAQMRIAVVDVKKAVAGSDAGKKARAILEKEKKRLEVELIKKRTGLEGMVANIRSLQLEIQQKGPIWRKEERDRKVENLRLQRRNFSRQEDELKRQVQESQRDLQSRQRTLMGGLIKQTREVVLEIAREGKYDLIIDRTIGGVLFVDKKVNITDQVIELYNKKKK